MQEDIEQKSVVLTTKTAKITGRVLTQLMLSALRKMKQEKSDTESLLKHIEFMETQFEMVFSELQAVRSQLQTIEDKSVKAVATRIVDTVDMKVSDAKTQFNGIKDSVATSFSNTLKAVEQKGVSALKGTLDFFKVHMALSFLKGKLGKAVDSLQKGIVQLENVKTEIHVAKLHAGNAGRLLLGKEAKAANTQNSELGVIAGVQKFLLRTSVLLTNISKVADSAMRKIEGLGERSGKDSVDKSIKEIKIARTSEKLSKSERDTAR